MNIYGKIQKVIVELQNMQVKKSGKNKFAGYEYFELSDILPNLNILLKNNNLFCQFNFFEHNATLTIRCTEKEESAEFLCTVAEAKMKGCQEIQNLGAVQTYVRRYLLVNAFAICECDMLDSTANNYQNENKKHVAIDSKIDKTQQNELFDIAKDIPKNQTLAILKKYGCDKSADINKKDFIKIINDFNDLQK